MSALEEFQAALATSTGRLLATAARLTDDDVRAASLLPGWTRGHVLTHLARNADSHVNLLTWARTGVHTPQYPTPETRETEIEAGAERPAKEQLADLEESADRFDRAVRELPPEAWRAIVEGTRPPRHPAWYILMRRLREVEIHHIDLGAGYGWADLLEPYVRWELHDTMLSWPHGQGPVSEIVSREVRDDGEHIQVWRGLGDGPAVHGTPRKLLAWLTGRAPGEGLSVKPSDDGGEPSGSPVASPVTPPSPPQWMSMPAPRDLPVEPPATWPPRHD
ncbi:maleylpyruvate isomerase family mycothiol-dependent enzyme [Planotetraspora sp. A-T 1434]|uniref:maleylpyruvate isomerase family mycothiol-dependent enzyme n=1 Tax=Planotetraspora sp. A-T 1434 TaxID=2979219 RepID=UPI0021C20CC2|nr:maleylpyruvate isomerase family mycothiol-dependent enzyme [Planotetraspora sp. A-T 1434]MCT9932820.1 maleylpyruvate isomerase family mycothiol-dependent enzyme [Planotetraspora sp. A-T 1434]